VPAFARDAGAGGGSTSQMKMSRVPWAKISTGLYALSLVLPAAVIDVGIFQSRRETVFGVQCLVQGFIVILPWLANPLLAIAALLLAARRPEFAVLVATCALGIASTMFFFDDMSLRVGAYVWLASIACLFIAACATLVAAEDSEAEPPAPTAVAQPGPDPGP
jgi:hypothetical protein